MKTIAHVLITALIFLPFTGVTQTHFSQQTQNTKVSTSTIRGVNDPIVGPQRLRVEQSAYKGNALIPDHDQIHSPIRWYAIENERNPTYWEHVNVNKIWLELEQGWTITQPEINKFLSKYDLTYVESESSRKFQANYWIFKLQRVSPQQIVDMAKAAKEIEGILFLEPSAIYKSSYTPDDPLYDKQWSLHVTHFKEAWDKGIGGKSLNVVAIIDDACDWSHEDLKKVVQYGYDYGENDSDIYPDDPKVQKHGTHISGIIAAGINNGIGIAGMVNDTVYFAKVGKRDGTLSGEGMVNAYYAIGDIDRVTVVNIGFGSSAPSAAHEQALNYAWNHGKLLLAPSGNKGTEAIAYPAAYPAAMAVGSITTNGSELSLAAYSQYGVEQEISAPGGDTSSGYGIVSCAPNDQYESRQGTSLATAHVSGLAGLMKHVNMNLTNAEIRKIIQATAIDMGTPGWDPKFGYGMINPPLAVEAAINGGAVRVAELNGNVAISIYPNPAIDYIFIDKIQSFENGTYDIIDITGTIVKSMLISNQQNAAISISELPKGVYMLRIQSEIGVIVSKFVKL